MMNSTEFDTWAGDYDQSIEPFLDKFPFAGYYDVLSYVQHLVKPVEGLKIMDVGIGTALLSYELFKSGCEIYGVDFSSRMIGKAMERIPEGYFNVVDVSRDHFGKYNNVRFDRVISSYFFHHLDLDAKIKCFKRIINDNLNKGGTVVVADVGFETRAEYDLAFKTYRKYWDIDEYYLCGNEMIDALKLEGIEALYRQISFCAGVLIYQAKS